MKQKQNLGRDEEDHTTKVVGIRKDYMRSINSKKAEGEFLALCSILLVIFLVIGAFESVPTSHHDCMDDCEDLFESNFEINCSKHYPKNFIGLWDCVDEEKTKLKEFCFDKCTIQEGSN